MSVDGNRTNNIISISLQTS